MQGWHYGKGLNCFKNFKTAPASICNANYLAQNSVYNIAHVLALYKSY